MTSKEREYRLVRFRGVEVQLYIQHYTGLYMRGDISQQGYTYMSLIMRQTAFCIVPLVGTHSPGHHKEGSDIKAYLQVEALGGGGVRH